ncbi:MAG: HAMP domain-containing histidine kinase [Holosporales bacterium]|jgi:two-component system osmolarity sensor histidine kinase EnvZ|nr:HAMP domain-containing histidine kinase [Holosporales bacterium]
MIRVVKKILPKSISSRFFTILIAPVVLSQLIFGIVFFGKYTDRVIGNISDQVAGDIKVIQKALDNSYEGSIVESIKESFDISIFVLKNSKLRKTGLAKRTKIYRIFRNSLIKKELSDFYIKPINKDIAVFLQSNNKNDIYKLYFKKQKLYTRIVPIVLGWGIASSIVLLIIAFIFLKNQIRPMKRLAKAAEQFGKGIDTNNFVPEGAKEIKMAGVAFCEMKSNFRKLLNNKLKTLAGVSHDLKTPLTKMELQLSLMPKTPEVLGLKQDVNMMIEITRSFTLHASEQLKEAFSSRNLFSLFFEISKDYNSSNFCIHIEGDKRMEILMKYVSLKRAFSNIVSNSKKYATTLYIKFTKLENTLEIILEDDGSGIRDEILDAIFSPFFSENMARTQNKTANVGLGLSVARDAIIDHGGEITAHNSKVYKGACFIVTLPL